MKIFYISLVTILFALISVIIFNYKRVDKSKIDATFALTKFFYMELGSNFYEPSSFDKTLSQKPNRVYPQMMQINRLDYIYE